MAGRTGQALPSEQLRVMIDRALEQIFYLAPKAKAGMEDVRNMRYVHCACQRIYAENRLKK